MTYSDCVNKPNSKINVVDFQHPWSGLFLPLKDREQFTILKTGVILRRRPPDSGEEAIVVMPYCWSWL